MRKASRLESVPLSGFCGAGFAAADLAASPVEALGFSELHFGAGGFAGFPQEIKKVTATTVNATCNVFVGLIKNHLSIPNGVI
ncbi:MAG: hypothetical protein ACREQO_23805 [Candidatus Binatia bacterium]